MPDVLKISAFFFLIYITSLIVIRLVLIKLGFSYSYCPACNQEIKRKRRNRTIRFASKLTLNILSFRKVECSKCKYEGTLLRRFRIIG